ncbi:peptidoglycan DD-metalloendopeptidase family protein [Streptomyces sp. SID8379]|uniref:M23 family metallopeptidase n=1 Tax=unclassified Streptomyces TaxID=2593676 RepID=UPI00036889C2|nr:M23 family metallopeptidase [Streptomyces sp. HmicA12]MYW68377.1 peptidoglycan DD-metalloendopeptidase family protein [Streptomyces sp. SID8379]
MNDRHPSGTAHYAAYDGYSTTSFAADPLFGDLPGDDAYSTGSYTAVAEPAHHTGTYDTGSYDTGSYETGSYDTGSYDTGHWYSDPGFQQQYADPYASSYDTGGYDTTAAWPTAAPGAPGYEQFADIPAQAGTQAGPQLGAQLGTHPEQHTGQWDLAAYDTGAYDATQWNSAGGDPLDPEAVHEHVHVPDQFSPAEPEPQPGSEPQPEAEAEPETEPEPQHEPALDEREFTPRAASRGRSRRRTPAKRSALLTVAVPSVCVVGVAGIAAASVGVGGGDDAKETQAASAPDASAVKPAAANNKLDTQLADLSQDAGDFADRASRTQERIDLKAKQEADRKKAAEEARRKEALRPKFALPVKQHGLSAYYGQAGINWMSVHSGIDFPVSYGTEVMAATDGTVRTQYNTAYGNMAIVTAKDGTETWYCHLSAHTVMSGPVKAGDVIARSGNSGNSTGPHLHFEVRPGGGSAIDPLPWLRSHGLDPT